MDHGSTASLLQHKFTPVKLNCQKDTVGFPGAALKQIWMLTHPFLSLKLLTGSSNGMRKEAEVMIPFQSRSVFSTPSPVESFLLPQGPGDAGFSPGKPNWRC